MSSYECNCAQCNNCDDPYADEHEENCCCDDCHEHSHIASEYREICDACREIDEQNKKENEDYGNDQQ